MYLWILVGKITFEKYFKVNIPINLCNYNRDHLKKQMPN